MTEAHRAKLFRDGHRWMWVCNCSASQSCGRWGDCFDTAFAHVLTARRIYYLGGVGFRVIKREPILPELR